MRYNAYTLLIMGVVVAVAPVYAAKPLSLQKASFSEIQQKFKIKLPGIRASRAESDNTLQWVGQHVDKNHVTHVRMQQQYAGYPVFGGYAVFHNAGSLNLLFSAKNHVKMNGQLYADLKDELGAPQPAFAEHAAMALQHFKSAYQQYPTRDEQVTPMVYINANHQAVWAYKVSVLVSPEDRIPERPTAILDARTYQPYLQWNDLKTSRKAVNGMGYGGNNQMGEYQYGKEFPLLQISRDPVSKICYMENKDVKVVDMVHKYSGPNHTMRFSCMEEATASSVDTFWTGYQADGYDQENGGYSPTNDALYAGQVIKNMYKDWYDIDVLTEEGKPMKLVMRVHFGRGYENAFWDSQQMTFGDGDSMMYPLVSVGISAHEISHGFTEQQSNLEYFGQSGGMNEAFSDMAAQAAEYYSQGKNSWKIGAEIMKEDSGYKALRYMDEPSLDGRSIEMADDYKDGLDVHYSSGVYNRLFYILSTMPEWDVKQAFHVMVKANMDYWTPYSTFAEGGCGMLDAARDLGYPVNDVKWALDQVAINNTDCSKSEP